MFFFFFEQKTAYEMRISDWSSDVCSSDLSSLRSACVASVEPLPGSDNPKASVRQFIELAVNIPEHDPQVGHAARSISVTSSSLYFSSAAATIASTRSSARSEEHPSALQSLMRSPYAVFCLKNKKQQS